MLEEVAVVAGHLDHEAPLVELEAVRDPVRVHAHVLDPAVGVGGEVRVLGEDLLAAHVLPELDQETPIADVDVQRVEALHVVEGARRHVALAERRTDAV